MDLKIMKNMNHKNQQKNNHNKIKMMFKKQMRRKMLQMLNKTWKISKMKVNLKTKKN